MSAWLRRELARQRSPALAANMAIGGDEVAAQSWVVGACSGHLERLAYELAGRIAVERHVVELGVELEREDAYDRFCADAVNVRDLQRVVTTRSLDWMVVEAEWLWFPDPDVAREAVLCVRDDGLPLAELMRATTVEARRRRFLADDLDAEFRPLLHGARVHDVVGPMPDADGFAVALVLDKSPPSLREELVCRRAQLDLIASAVDHQVERWVRWVDHL